MKKEKDLYSFAREYGLRAQQVIDVSAGICPLGPSRKVKTEIRKAVRDLDVYPDPASSSLRKFFRSKFGVPEESMIFANSLRELLFHIPSVFKPERVLIAGPALPICANAAAESGARVKVLSASADAAFATDIRMITGNLEGSDLLFISNPNRITGRLINKSDVLEMIGCASAKKTLTVVDESLMEFTGEEGLVREAAVRDNLIVLRTTANYHGLPGLELACALSGDSVIKKLQEKLTSTASALASEAARIAYKDRAYARQVKEFIQKERSLFAKTLKKADKITFCESDSNVFLLRTECIEGKLNAALARAGFLIKNCADIEGLGASYLRLSVMKHDHNLKLLRILRENCI